MKRALLALTCFCAAASTATAQEVNTSTLSENGWYSDDTRADGSGSESAGTNLISDTLTDDPEGSASGVAGHNADINDQIIFGDAIGAEPVGTHGGAVHLLIDGGGSGKSQISHRIDDGTGHFSGALLGPGFTAEYSWMGDGTVSVTASLKFGIKTSDFGSTGVSGRTGENVWDKVLIYEPGNLNGGTSDGAWHTETIDWTTGVWWFFDRTTFASTIGNPMTLEEMSTSTDTYGAGLQTIADVYALITAGHVTSVQFGIGSGNAGGSVYVNQFECSAYRPGMTTTFGTPSPYDQDATPDVIFGSGNANGSFTVDRQNGIELGLRAKVRFPVPMNVFHSNGDGTYTYSTGAGGGGSPTPLWSFEWTVNSDYDGSSGLNLDDLTYEIGMDFDPSSGTNYLAFDHITPGTTIPYSPPTAPIPFFDHAIGDNSTPNGGGTSAGDGPTYEALLAANNVAQNSWRMDFFDEFPFDIFDPDVPGRYEFYLAAYELGVEVARTHMTVIVADGATMALEADPCQADVDPVKSGTQIAVDLWLRNPDATEVTGYQAFLEFDDSTMTYEGACSTYGGGPLDTHIQPIATAEVAAGELRLDGNTFGGPGTTDDLLLATLIFTVSECATNDVDFDLTQGFPSELSFFGSPIATDLVNSPDIVSDNIAPSITCPADIAVSSDASIGDGCQGAYVSWADPIATDSCTGVTVVCVPPSGSFFDAGTTTEVTCTATDECGNTETCTFDVTVSTTNTVHVDLHLVGSGSATRCLYFVLDDCGVFIDEPITVDGGGMFSGTIEVPCGNWSSICVKDEQHTQWANGLLVVSGSDYVLDVSTPLLEMYAGDTDNDGDVDINDVTLLIAQFGGPEPAGGCPWDTTRGADFNNDGTVSSPDYSLMIGQWLTTSSCGCTAGPVVIEVVSTSIHVNQIDPWIAHRADLNGDSFVNAEDVKMFERKFGLGNGLSSAMERTEKEAQRRSTRSGRRR